MKCQNGKNEIKDVDFEENVRSVLSERLEDN